MNAPGSSRLEALFRALVARRRAIIALYAVLIPLAAAAAARIPSDSSIDRLVVQSDADFRAREEFRRLFPERAQVILLAQAPDPFAPEVLRRAAEIEAALRQVPRVSPFSAPTVFEQARPGGAAADRPEEFRAFATGTDLLRRQGLVGPGFLGIPVTLDVESPADRDRVLGKIDRALAPFLSPPLTGLGKVGGPYVDAWLEGETARAGRTAFPLLGAFVVVITLSLYRSVRTLLAFLLTLAAAVACALGLGHLAGYAFTIVSSLVPLTILITTTAALVYLQSRFIEIPEGRSIEDHQAFALANKFLATTASMFAAAIGFAALAVSKIRPIREMGLWVGAGILVTWVVVFTLFPALQSLLRTPVRRAAAGADGGWQRLFDRLPLWTWRFRWPLLAGSFLLMVAGTVALLGLPGRIAPLPLQTDALDYVDPRLPIVRDTRLFERAISGLSQVEVWVTTPEGRALDPEILRGLDAFSRRLEADDRIGTVTGPITTLRFLRYAAGGGDRLPAEPSAWPGLAASLDQLLLNEPALRDQIDINSLSHLRLTVLYQVKGFAGVEATRAFFGAVWEAAAAEVPALREGRMRIVGQGLLQAKIAEYLVPTLTESFLLTAAIIFLAFLVVFRSGAARLMAMIPSVFAILAMFPVMRACGIPLNVATILIASTVLGASENDQIHFFYHLQEGRRGAGLEAAMHHALRIAGRAILFATLINAGGFLALSFSGLPPMRQFGILASSAFVLSMLASLTALPAALWVVSGERPTGAMPAPRRPVGAPPRGSGAEAAPGGAPSPG
ncbi:MAG TPA: MMPL family transporter [Candidatus Polarisedimenticolia bacterium]|nr:MMPL family transporter [Candidatus Polarisedimenticolia bacterium]